MCFRNKLHITMHLTSYFNVTRVDKVSLFSRQPISALSHDIADRSSRIAFWRCRYTSQPALSPRGYGFTMKSRVRVHQSAGSSEHVCPGEKSAVCMRKETE